MHVSVSLFRTSLCTLRPNINSIFCTSKTENKQTNKKNTCKQSFTFLSGLVSFPFLLFMTYSSLISSGGTFLQLPCLFPLSKVPPSPNSLVFFFAFLWVRKLSFSSAQAGDTKPGFRAFSSAEILLSLRLSSARPGPPPPPPPAADQMLGSFQSLCRGAFSCLFLQAKTVTAEPCQTCLSSQSELLASFSVCCLSPSHPQVGLSLLSCCCWTGNYSQQ